MNYFKKSVISAAMVLLASSAFAKQMECPSVSTISANSTFVKAIQSDRQNVWGLLSNPFTSQGNDWSLIFGVILPDVSSQSDALQQGQDYYNSNVVLNEPVAQTEGDLTICIYSSPYQANYFVGAVNPALNFSTPLAKFATKLK